MTIDKENGCDNSENEDVEFDIDGKVEDDVSSLLMMYFTTVMEKLKVLRSSIQHNQVTKYENT